jgi:hypothetical protein
MPYTRMQLGFFYTRRQLFCPPLAHYTLSRSPIFAGSLPEHHLNLHSAWQELGSVVFSHNWHHPPCVFIAMAEITNPGSKPFRAPLSGRIQSFFPDFASFRRMAIGAGCLCDKFPSSVSEFALTNRRWNWRPLQDGVFLYLWHIAPCRSLQLRLIQHIHMQLHKTLRTTARPVFLIITRQELISALSLITKVSHFIERKNKSSNETS